MSECPAVDAPHAAPGSASGQPSPPSERELLCVVLQAVTVLTQQQAELIAVLADVAEQNATIIGMLGEIPQDEAEAPAQYLSGKPAR